MYQISFMINILEKLIMKFIKGVLHTCFVRYLKITNTFMKNNIYIL